MTDSAQMSLKEPEQVNWDKVGGSNYIAPPKAKDASGKYITYFGQLPSKIETTETDDAGYRQYLLDPIKLVKNGANGGDGTTIRFARVGLKPWSNGNNGTAILLKAAGVSQKPQKTAEYDQAIKTIGGKIVPFSIEWSARNKETGETVRGYSNFPDDPTRPGEKKSILKAGDTFLDENGVSQVVQSEVLFANAQLRFFEAKGK